MDLKITTTQIDATEVLTAYRLYKENKFREAMPMLQGVLDVEPQNWQARLFLGACYFKTAQTFAAQRAFRFVMDNCKDAELRQKACLALHAVNSELDKKRGVMPAEFDSIPLQRTSIESIVC